MITLTVTIEEVKPGTLVIDWQGKSQNLQLNEQDPANRIALRLTAAIEEEQKIMAAGRSGWAKSIGGCSDSETLNATIEEVKNRLRDNNNSQ